MIIKHLGHKSVVLYIHRLTARAKQDFTMHLKPKKTVCFLRSLCISRTINLIPDNLIVNPVDNNIPILYQPDLSAIQL